MAKKFKKKVYNPVPIKDALNENKTTVEILKKLKEYNVKIKWRDIVGDNLYKVSAPKSIIKHNMFINVKSSSWANELTFHAADIKEKVNDFLGENIVKKLTFKVGDITHLKPHEVKKEEYVTEFILEKDTELRIEKTISEIEDKGLQEIIKKAMEKSLSKKQV